MISLWETTSSNVTGLYFSTLCVCSLLVVILNAREISCTKGVCRLFPLRGPQVHRQGQPCLSLWQLTVRKEVPNQFVAFLHHCPCLICKCVGLEGASYGLASGSMARDAYRLGRMRWKTLFISHAQTIDKKCLSSPSIICTCPHPKTGLPRRRLHRSARWIDRGVRSACFLSFYYTQADFPSVQDADLR